MERVCKETDALYSTGYHYLGGLLTTQLSKRIQLAYKCYFGMGTLLKSGSTYLNLKTKM